MLLNYLKLAIRLLIRNPFFSIINVVGLSIGFAAFFSLWSYSTAELKTDQHHKDFRRIVRIGFHMHWKEQGNSEHQTFGVSKASFPPQFKNDFPEVESYMRISEQAAFHSEELHEGHGVRMIVSYRNNGVDKLFKETKAAYADRNIFEFFTIPMIHGDPETVLAGVNFVALSQSLSEKYFGKENPVGEVLMLNDSIMLKVNGVFEDFPHNSRLKYDMILSNDGLLMKWSTEYFGVTHNFVKLKDGTPIKDFEDKINREKQKYWGSILKDWNVDHVMFAQPLKEISFQQGFIGDEGNEKSRGILITLAVVSVVILMMAWINYINLSVTRMINRMKEFATRRVNGATALDLIKQFVTESFLINALAAGLSLTILQLIRQPLEGVFEIYIVEIWSTKTEVWFGLLLTVVAGTLITGVYPAYVCVTRQPRLIFMMKSHNSNKSFVPSLLTTMQFTAAIALISWVFVVYLQLNYILNKDMGLNREGVVIVEGPIVKPDHYEQIFGTFMAQLNDLREIEQSTSSRHMVGDEGNMPGQLERIGTSIHTSSDGNGVHENYIPFFGLKVLAGRNFVKDDRADVIILSQTSARQLGFNSPEDAVGVKVNVNITSISEIEKNAEVIGVIQDYRLMPYFNYAGSNTVEAAVGRGVFLIYKNRLFPEQTQENIAIKIGLENIDEAITAVEKRYKKFFPGNTFTWRFLDDQINRAYGNEKVARNQILMFTLLAIGIAVLGLVAMMAQRILEKTKEVGIRKVLGASVFELGKTLVRSTGIQFLIATALGIPLAYYLGDQYLQRYSERIMLNWWDYLLPVVILLVIMFFTVANMLWKAVQSNPVESLKHE